MCVCKHELNTCSYLGLTEHLLLTLLTKEYECTCSGLYAIRLGKVWLVERRVNDLCYEFVWRVCEATENGSQLRELIEKPNT